MKFLFITCIISLLFISCKESLLQERLSQSDSLIIQFFDKNVLKNAAATGERTAIEKLIRFVGNDTITTPGCPGRDGRLIFFSENTEIQRIEFRSKEKGCTHFSYTIDGRQVYTKMSNEGADFLASIEEGKSYY